MLVRECDLLVKATVAALNQREGEAVDGILTEMVRCEVNFSHQKYSIYHSMFLKKLEYNEDHSWTLTFSNDLTHTIRH